MSDEETNKREQGLKKWDNIKEETKQVYIKIYLLWCYKYNQ